MRNKFSHLPCSNGSSITEIARSRRQEEVLIAIGEPVRFATTWDPLTNSSSMLLRMNYRWRAGVVSLGDGQIMIVAGGGNHATFRTVQMIDCKKRQVCQIHPINIPRWGHGVCAVEKDVLIAGGWNGYRLNSCELYMRNEARWRHFTEMAETHYDAPIISLPGRRAFVFGGLTALEIASSTTEVCTLPVELTPSPRPASVMWRCLAPMRQARCGHAATLCEGKIFAAGGWSEISSVEVFIIPTDDNDSGQWISLNANMIVHRCWFSLVVFSNVIYAIGNHNPPHNSVECLRTHGWSEINYEADGVSSSQWVPMRSVPLMFKVWNVFSLPKYLIPTLQ